MPASIQTKQPRVIIIPRQLEGFFYQRLSQRFALRDDIQIIVDRRVGDRRQERWVSGPGPLAERRRGDRRADQTTWSLPDMPVSTP
jgi:hypothetical protein